MRDPLPAPEHRPTLIAVGSDIGADRIAWDVAARLTLSMGLTAYRCRSPATELPALLRTPAEVVIVDALLSDARDIQELDPRDLQPGHRASGGHGLGVGETLRLLAVLRTSAPHIRLVGLPIGVSDKQPDHDLVARYAAQLEALLSQSSMIPARNRRATQTNGR
ncbi:MAG: hypothetical protein H6926_05860 [Chromatiales bacterium]|nr:hypothetical protein [Chromatiales bacterium]